MFRLHGSYDLKTVAAFHPAREKTLLQRAAAGPKHGAHARAPRTLGLSSRAVIAMGVLWVHLRVFMPRILSSRMNRNRSTEMVLRAGPS